MFTMGDLKQTRVYQDAYREALAKGRNEGIPQGEARAILRLLSRKFGSLSPELTQQITALPAESLDNLTDAILDMQELDDLIGWLSRAQLSLV